MRVSGQDTVYFDVTLEGDPHACQRGLVTLCTGGEFPEQPPTTA